MEETRAAILEQQRRIEQQRHLIERLEKETPAEAHGLRSARESLRVMIRTYEALLSELKGTNEDRQSGPTPAGDPASSGKLRYPLEVIRIARRQREITTSYRATREAQTALPKRIMAIFGNAGVFRRARFLVAWKGC